MRNGGAFMAVPSFSQFGNWLATNWAKAFIGVIILFVLMWLGLTLWNNPLILFDLRDQAYARGVITLLICVVALMMGLMLIVTSFFMEGTDEEANKRFSRAREIFTVFMGILGTIVGFYFGSTDRVGSGLVLADIKLIDEQVMTHVSGGAKPYRYSITSSDKEFKVIQGRISQDGWIVEKLEKLPKTDASITIEVTDGKDQRASKEAKPAAPQSGPNPIKSGPVKSTTQRTGSKSALQTGAASTSTSTSR
jgi:hypothetical protein